MVHDSNLSPDSDCCQKLCSLAERLTCGKRLTFGDRFQDGGVPEGVVIGTAPPPEATQEGRPVVHISNISRDSDEAALVAMLQVCRGLGKLYRKSVSIRKLAGNEFYCTNASLSPIKIMLRSKESFRLKLFPYKIRTRRRSSLCCRYVGV